MAADPRPVEVETTPPPPPVSPAPDAAGQPAHPDPPAPDNETLGNRIAELAAHIQAATWELLVLIRQFDAADGWEGFASCAAWLSWRIGLAPGAAREHVRVARALAELPKLSDAMQCGAVSYSKLRAVTRVATPETEQALLDVALAGTAAHVEQVVRTWRRVDRAAEQTEEQQRHESRALDTWVDDNGMVVVRGRLTPEVGAVVRRALEAALDAAAPNPGGPAVGDDGQPRSAAGDGAAGDAAEAMVPTVAQRRADALGMVAECALAGGLDKGTAGDRYQVVVHVDADTLADGGQADDGGADEIGSDESGAGNNSADDNTEPADGHGVAADAAEDERRVTAAPDVPAGTSPQCVAASAAADEASGAPAGGADGPAPSTARPAPAAPEPVRPATRPGTHGQAACPGLAGGQSVLDEAGGIHVSAETARRLACDAATVTMHHGPAGEVLDVGRRTRTISPALRRALAARDGHCRFPGCRARRVDAHHVEHWAHGGATALDNLVLLCRRHHRAVHEGGFRVALGAAGDVRFVRPDGRPLEEAPPLPKVVGPPLAPVVARLERAGIRLGPQTGTPAWRGERLDVDWAVSVLWRRRPQAAPEGGPPA